MLYQQLSEFAEIREFSLEKFDCCTDEKKLEKLQGELLQIKVVSEYNALKLQHAMKRNKKLLDTSLS